MSWLVLVVSGGFEAVWAVALSKSDGFKKLLPTIVFALALIISVGGLAWAMLEIPTGTAYAVWVGMGATLAVVWSFLTGVEKPDLAKILLLIALVGSVIGLKLVS